MNNEINVISENVPLMENIKSINNVWRTIALLSSSIGFILAIINIIICLLTMKEIKRNRIWCIISIVALIINYIPKVTYAFDGRNDMYMYVIQIIYSIIEIIIFILLIINIVKNRKKEEP